MSSTLAAASKVETKEVIRLCLHFSSLPKSPLDSIPSVLLTNMSAIYQNRAGLVMHCSWVKKSRPSMGGINELASCQEPGGVLQPFTPATALQTPA